MTARNSNFTGLLYYNPVAYGFNPVQQVTINCADSMNEYDTLAVDIVTWDIADSTTLYWRVVPHGTNLTTGRFSNGDSGFVSMYRNRASFSIAVSADDTTAVDAQSFDIIVSKTENGPALVTRLGVIVNDTSQDPQILVMDLDPANYQPAGSSTITITTTFSSDYAGGFPGPVSGGSFIRYDGTIPQQPHVGDTFDWNGTTRTIAQLLLGETFPSGQEQYYFIGFYPAVGKGEIGVGQSIDILHSSDGLTISDASGQSHPGTLSNGVGYSGSGNSSYFTLDGANDFIVIPTLQNSRYSSVTMSLWFNSSSDTGSLMTKELSYKMRLGSSGHVNVLVGHTGSSWDYSVGINSTYMAGAWHHVAVAISPDHIKWYYDGVPVMDNAGVGALGINTQPFMIGSYGQGTSEFFTGKIGPARLYNYAITDQQVTDYYNATKDRYQPTPPSSFTKLYGTTAPDGFTSASLIWNSAFPQDPTGWTISGQEVPPGVTVLTYSYNGNQAFTTLSQEIHYLAVTYTFTAP